MKSFSQLPPDEALRRLEDGGFDAVKDRYLALKALGPGADAEVDSIEYDMKKFASKAQELKANQNTPGGQPMQQPLESGASKKASGHGPQPKPVVLADTDLLVTIFSGKPQIPQIRTHKIMTQNHPPRSSHTNLEDLELTRLQDLQVPKIHQGKYCLGMIGTKPVGENRECCMFPFIDTSGGAMMCRVYNFEVLPVSLRPATDMHFGCALRYGTFVAIKEPNVVEHATVANLRIDTITDFVFFRPDDPKLLGPGKLTAAFPYKHLVLNLASQPIDDFKTPGNKAFQVGQWTLADVCYSAGLWQHKKHAQAFLLYLNRSAARLPLEHYQGAYEDAVRASQLMASSASKLATPDQKRKGLLRQAKALYGMEQWTSCHEVLEQCLFTFPNPGLDHQDLFSKVKQRLLEQSQGAYDFPALYKQLLEHKYRLDVASYGGPFEIKPSLIPGAGRGAFATRDIQPGELVMADKAMASAWEGESFKPLSIADISRRRGTRPRQTQLIVEMMFKQNYGHPSVRDRVLDLSTKGLEDLDRSKHAGIDPDRTQSLAIAYAFSLYAPPDAVEANGNGVFFDASFPNSQCVPNCRWVSLGDVMLVKALRPIAAGEEIYLNYISYSTMLTRSARICNWFPICTCSDCQQDRMAPPGALKKREKLMNISVTVLQDNGKLTELYQAIKFLQNSIEELKTTFTKQQLNSGTPYELAVLYDQEAEVRASIGRQIGSQDQLKKAILLRKKALEGYGVQLDQAAWKLKHGSNLPVVTLPLRNFESIVDHCHCLKRLYESLGPSKAEQTAWVKAAEWISDGILAPGLYKLMHQ